MGQTWYAIIIYGITICYEFFDYNLIKLLDGDKYIFSYS